VLGRYRLLRTIGEGGMGVVHLASGPDGRRVAVKVLRPHVVGNGEGRARLAREVASLQRVRSDRVAEFLDADPWGPTPFVVTRFVPGLSLSDYINEYGPLRGPAVLQLAGGLAEALAAVHAVGVIHRDVKPSNVLLEGHDPVLIDFGLARAAEDASVTMTGWMMGTPAYLTPEIALGEEPGPATDVHSWASTVAFACRGTSPFGRGPQSVLLDRVRRNAYELEGVPGDLVEVLVRCLDEDPRARPPATVLAGWLAGSANGAPATVHVPAAPQPPQVAPAGSGPDGGKRSTPANTPPGGAAATAVVDAAPAVVETVPGAGPSPAVPAAAAPDQAGGVYDRAGEADGHADELNDPDHEQHQDAQDRSGPRTTVMDAAPPQLEWGPDVVGASHPPLIGPPAPERPPRSWTERIAAAAIAGLLSVLVVALFAAAPYVTVAVGWLLVAGLVTWDRAVEARRRRRSVRGVRRGDGVVATFLAPWHAAAGIAHATVLVGAALLAAALVDGLLHLASVETRRLVWAGAVAFALVMWRGPGGHVLHRPAARTVSRGASAGAWAIAVIWLLAAVAAGTIGYVQGVGTTWFPAADAPL
jgi:hypothetical protein